jgi:hypothetical protein
MKNSKLNRILILFSYSIVVSVFIYVAISLFGSNPKNGFVQALQVIGFFLPVLIFPFFAVLAIKHIREFTESFLLRVLILVPFAFFPIILLFGLIFISILTGNFRPIIGL